MRRRRHEPPTSLLSRREWSRLLWLTVLAGVALTVIYRAFAVPGEKEAVKAEMALSKKSPETPLKAKCPEVDRALLAAFQDKTPTGPEETRAIHQLLCVAATKGGRALAQESRRDVLLANLFSAPDRYRGELIHAQGVLTRLVLTEVDPAQNPFGIEKFYEGWIFTDHQAEVPLVFLFTELPDGLAPGDSLNETVQIDGYFAKLLAYRARSGKGRAAPMLVGSTVAWTQADAGPPSWEIPILAGGFVGFLALVSYFVFRTMRREDDEVRRLREESEDIDSTPSGPAKPLEFMDPNEPSDD